jgi:hypothetical protein
VRGVAAYDCALCDSHGHSFWSSLVNLHTDSRMTSGPVNQVRTIGFCVPRIMPLNIRSGHEKEE